MSLVLGFGTLRRRGIILGVFEYGGRNNYPYAYKLINYEQRPFSLQFINDLIVRELGIIL